MRASDAGLLGHPVEIVLMGDPGADVEELADPGFAREVTDRAANEVAVGPDVTKRPFHAAIRGRLVLRRLTIDREVRLTTGQGP